MTPTAATGLSDAELEQQQCTWAGRLAAATAEFLRLLAEFDAREAWGGPGVRSCAHWLSWRCGMGLQAARDHVRVARRLRPLPVTAAAFAEGRLSYTNGAGHLPGRDAGNRGRPRRRRALLDCVPAGAGGPLAADAGPRGRSGHSYAPRTDRAPPPALAHGRGDRPDVHLRVARARGRRPRALRPPGCCRPGPRSVGCRRRERFTDGDLRLVLRSRRGRRVLGCRAGVAEGDRCRVPGPGRGASRCRPADPHAG